MAKKPNYMMPRKKDTAPLRYTVAHTIHMEVEATSFRDFLIDNGLRAFVTQRSRSIVEEPYVEWTWNVYIEPRHTDEVALAKRLRQSYDWGTRKQK